MFKSGFSGRRDSATLATVTIHGAGDPQCAGMPAFVA